MLPFGLSLDYANTKLTVLEQLLRDNKYYPKVPLWKKIFGVKSGYDLYNRIKALDKKIVEESNKKHNVSKVIITFETEIAKRGVLESLQKKSIIERSSLFLKTMASRMNKADRVPSPGDNMLSIREPDEPDSIRWFDLAKRPWVSCCFVLIMH